MPSWRDYQSTPDANSAASPVGAAEGNYRGNVVNDTFRYMMAVIRGLGDTTLKIATGEGSAFTAESTAGSMALQNANAVVITGGSISGVTLGSIPVGAIVPFSGTTPATTLTEAATLVTSGWAICDGRTVSGRTTPDLRGTFIRGWTNTITPGVTGGIASATTSSDGSHSHTGTTSTDGSHNHNGSTTGAVSANFGGTFTKTAPGATFDQHTHPIASDGGHTHTMTTNSASAHTHSVATLPPYYAVVYLQRVA